MTSDFEERKTNVHQRLMKSIDTIAGHAEDDDEDGTLLEDAKRTADTCGVPLEKEALRVFILGVGMGVVMDGDSREERQEKAKPLLKRMMYLHKLASEGRL